MINSIVRELLNFGIMAPCTQRNGTIGFFLYDVEVKDT